MYDVCCMLHDVCCMLYDVCCMMYVVCCMMYVAVMVTSRRLVLMFQKSWHSLGKSAIRKRSGSGQQRIRGGGLKGLKTPLGHGGGSRPHVSVANITVKEHVYRPTSELVSM